MIVTERFEDTHNPNIVINVTRETARATRVKIMKRDNVQAGWEQIFEGTLLDYDKFTTVQRQLIIKVLEFSIKNFDGL